MLNTLNKIITEFLPKVPYGITTVKDIEKPACTRLEKDGLNTAIMFAFPYKVQEKAPKNLSRYSAVADYHKIILPKLNLLCQKLEDAFLQHHFKAFADYSPILEVQAASKAGLGVIGKNGLLITKEYGSFVFLGEILCDLEINTADLTKHCNNCGACLKACPVALNKEACISALTQKKGELTPEEVEKVKKATVFGCDICQNACPLNNGAKITFVDEFLNSYRNEYTPNEDDANRPYAWRPRGVINRNFEIFEEK